MFLQKLLRTGAIALVLTILLFSAAMAMPWALAQSPSTAAIDLAVENPSARQDTGAGKKVDSPKVQKKPSAPDDDEAPWSKPEGGLQARLRLERGDSINGTPILRVVLDLRNVST
jgi:hypothetical protein